MHWGVCMVSLRRPRAAVFYIIRILKARQPAVIVLENVKNLKSHDKGITFKVIKNELVKAGYWIANLDDDQPIPENH